MNILSVFYPGGSSPDIINKFKRDMVKFTSYRTPYFIKGDLNSRHRFWNCAASNAAGRALFDLMCQSSLQIHFSNDPTYIPEDPNRSVSNLDLVLTNGQIPMSTTTISDELSNSDHKPLLFTINEQTPIANDLYHVRDYKNANWSRFKEIINVSIDLHQWTVESLSTSQQIDAAIQLLNDSNLSTLITYS